MMNFAPDTPEEQKLESFLARLHRTWVFHSAGRWLFFALGVLCGLFWILVPLEHFAGLPVVVRVGLWVILSVAILTSVILLVRVLGNRALHRARAIDLERFAPELREQLITAVDVSESRRSDELGYAPWLVKHTLQLAWQRVSTINLAGFWQTAGLARGFTWFAGALVATVALGMLFPTSAGRTLFAVTHPTEEIPRPIPFEWSVTSGDKTLLQYESITLEATAQGRKKPISARLVWRYGEEGQPFTEELSPDVGREHLFRHTISSLPKSIEYWFEADERESVRHTIRVTTRPELVTVTGRCLPPTYTGTRAFGLLPASQRWVVPEGSRIELSATSDRDLNSGFLSFADSSQVALETVGRQGDATFKVSSRRTFRVFVRDTAGFDNYDPVPIDVETIPDLAPQIALLEPGDDRDIPDAMTVPVAVALLDDYGFSRLDMIFQVVGEAGTDEDKVQSLALPASFGKEGVFQFDWSLMDLRLFPGDRVMYRARVYDNRQPESRWAETRTFVLRLPTLDEIIAETERNQSRRADQVADAVKQQKDMAADLREMARELAGQNKVEWEDRQQLEAAMATQEELAKNLEKWAEEVEREAETLAENRMTSLEMIQKMNEISRLLEEVMTPELQEAMQKLQEAMESMSPEEMRQALEDFQMSQEEILQQLERTLAQLQQMKLEQMMENMLRSAEQLAENQEEQNRGIEAATDQSTMDSLAREEQALKQELQELKQKAAELAKENSEAKNRPEVNEFAEAAQQSEAGSDMEAMTSEMQQGQQSEASQSGKKAGDKLRNMLAQMQQQMMNMQNQMDAEQLQALQDLTQRTLSLSEEQEAMGDSTRSLSHRSLALREMAAEQAAIRQGLQTLLEDFNEMSRENLFLSPDVRKHLSAGRRTSDDARRSLGERNGMASQSFQYETMFSLNEATKSLMESMQNQSQCQGQSPGQGQAHAGMQGLSQQQLELNQQAQGMRNPHGLSSSEQQAVQRLSAQQQSIQRSMQDMAERFSQSRDRLGRLDEMAQSMDEIIEDMDSGTLDDETLERQRKVYNRMLDFQKSLQKQDFENRRRSQQGTELAGRAPDPLESQVQDRARDEARWERFKNEWYPPGFRALVKEYFEAVTRPDGETQ